VVLLSPCPGGHVLAWGTAVVGCHGYGHGLCVRPRLLLCTANPTRLVSNFIFLVRSFEVCGFFGGCPLGPRLSDVVGQKLAGVSGRRRRRVAGCSSLLPCTTDAAWPLWEVAVLPGAVLLVLGLAWRGLFVAHLIALAQAAGMPASPSTLIHCPASPRSRGVCLHFGWEFARGPPRGLCHRDVHGRPDRRRYFSVTGTSSHCKGFEEFAGPAAERSARGACQPDAVQRNARCPPRNPELARQGQALSCQPDLRVAGASRRWGVQRFHTGTSRLDHTDTPIYATRTQRYLMRLFEAPSHSKIDDEDALVWLVVVLIGLILRPVRWPCEPAGSELVGASGTTRTSTMSSGISPGVARRSHRFSQASMRRQLQLSLVWSGSHETLSLPPFVLARHRAPPAS